MTRDEIRDKVVSAVAERHGQIEKSAITDGMGFAGELGFDSLDVVEIVMDLEAAFELSIPDEEAEKLKTVGDVVSYIEGKQAAPA